MVKTKHVLSIFLLFSLLLIIVSCIAPKTESGNNSGSGGPIVTQTRYEFFYFKHKKDHKNYYDVLQLRIYPNQKADIWAAHNLKNLSPELISRSLYQLLQGGSVINENGDIDFPYADGTGYDYFYRISTGAIIHYDLTGHPVTEWLPFELHGEAIP